MYDVTLLRSYLLFVILLSRITSSGEMWSCFNKSSSETIGVGIVSVGVAVGSCRLSDFALACLAKKPPPFFFPELFAFRALELIPESTNQSFWYLDEENKLRKTLCCAAIAHNKAESVVCTQIIRTFQYGGSHCIVGRVKSNNLWPFEKYH